MSDLQLGLLIIGVVVIAAVFAYNKWQDVKYRKLAEQRFASAHPDALLERGTARAAAPGPASGEPTAAGDLPDDIPDLPPPDAALSEPHEAARIEPTFEMSEAAAAERPPADEFAPAAAAAAPAVAAAAQAPQSAAPAAATGGVDYIVRLGGPADPVLLSDLAAQLAQNFDKLVWIQGWDDATGSWTGLTPELRSQSFCFGIQLADRDGALPPDDIARFQAGARMLAEQAGLAGLELPDAAAAAATARELDQFCSEVDMQVVLNLVSTGPAFAGTKIRALAESSGFALDGDGSFRLHSEDGAVLFALSNHNPAERFEAARMRELTSYGIAFQYDLPRVQGGIRSFDHFCEIARNFAQVLGGRLVDDNRAEIGPQALRAIRGQVQQVQASMESHGMPAGSAVAQRLFS
jgi:FtsZ-interacting cell division protein ZipA